MAANRCKPKFGKSFICILLFIQLIAVCHQIVVHALETEYVFTVEDILSVVDHSCFIGFSVSQKSDLKSIFKDVVSAFKQEDNVVLGFADLRHVGEQFKQAHGTWEEEASSVAVFQKVKQDRTCLSVSAVRKREPKVGRYNGQLHLDMLIEFINEHCDTYRNSRGHLTVAGLHRQEILQSLFHVHHVSDVSMRKLNEESQYCSHDICSNRSPRNPDTVLQDSSSEYISSTHEHTSNNLQMPTCEKVPYPTKQDFFHKYLKLSKPVIFTGAMENWSARTKWSNTYLREKYGEEQIHIKLTPSGEYEGIDSADQFENVDSFSIPKDVKQQLLFPDLVVVRPATANMKLSKFIDIVEEVSNGTRHGFSAYLEYSSLADIVSDLENDIEEMPFFDSMLQLKHLNVWLSDGNTLGKLHFDPFDNFLCQISGRKEVILFEPHDNQRLYEAHIPEAMLDYNQTSKTFSKKTLVDSTSMVMSPVDLKKPDFKRFPLFADTYPINCTIDEGEVLFMPAFWWHEVQSHPNREQGRNLAVNFCVDASKEDDTLARLVNHGSKKIRNAAMKEIDGHLCLFAQRDIDVGEELLYDYGLKCPWEEAKIRQRVQSKMAGLSPRDSVGRRRGRGLGRPPKPPGEPELSPKALEGRKKTGQPPPKPGESSAKSGESPSKSCESPNKTADTSKAAESPGKTSREEDSTQTTDVNGNLSSMDDTNDAKSGESLSKSCESPNKTADTSKAAESPGKTSREEDSTQTTDVNGNLSSMDDTNDAKSGESLSKSCESPNKTADTSKAAESPGKTSREEDSTQTTDVNGNLSSMDDTNDAISGESLSKSCESPNKTADTSKAAESPGKTSREEDSTQTTDVNGNLSSMDDTNDTNESDVNEIHQPDVDYVSDSGSDTSDIYPFQALKPSVVVADKPSVKEADSTTDPPSKDTPQIQTVSRDRRGKHDYNKKHCCIFCGKLDLKIARHLEKKHSNEAVIASLPKTSKDKNSESQQKRERTLDALRNQCVTKHSTNLQT